MESVTATNLRTFFQNLSERYSGPATVYLLGGSALCLLGNPRTTRDVDYTFEVAPEDVDQFRTTVTALGDEMRLDLKDIPFEEADSPMSDRET